MKLASPFANGLARRLAQSCVGTLLGCYLAASAQAQTQFLPPVDDAPQVAPPGMVAPLVPLDQPLPPLEELEPLPVSAVTYEAPTDALTKQVQALAGEIKAMKEAEKKKQGTFPTHKITGFTQLDTAFYSQSAQNRATVGDAQDGTGFRRARLAVQGNVAEFTKYQIEMDFATAGRPSFFDTYIEQSNVPFFGAIKVGQFCQPFSVDSLTGFRNLVFLERSLPFLAMVPFRRVGISAANQSEDELTQWTYSVYRTGGFMNAPLGDNRFATDISDQSGFSFAARSTHLLWYDEHANDRYLWHVGGGYTYAAMGANDAGLAGVSGNAGSPVKFYQARTTPEFGTLGYPDYPGNFGSGVNGTPFFVDTGRYEADSFNLFGAETLAQWGPWAMQAEYMATVVNSAVGPITYQGGYGQVAYHITGENRAYDKKTGTLGKLVPYTDFIPLKRDGICGWGAWEVGARWSVIDLRNPDSLNGRYLGNTSSAGNGVLNDATLGITWFLNTHTKLQVNWIHAMLDNDAKGFSDADLFVGRAQIDY
ncbi:MAG TPA: porin [Pirellulaceae bacterium]|nr:porin [Pirellulaceae bacterium]